MFSEQRSPFLILMGEMDFCLLLFCAVLLVTVLFLFQKPAINNTLTSKSVHVILYISNNVGKLINA